MAPVTVATEEPPLDPMDTARGRRRGWDATGVAVPAAAPVVDAAPGLPPEEMEGDRGPMLWLLTVVRLAGEEQVREGASGTAWLQQGGSAAPLGGGGPAQAHARR